MPGLGAGVRGRGRWGAGQADPGFAQGQVAGGRGRDKLSVHSGARLAGQIRLLPCRVLYFRQLIGTGATTLLKQGVKLWLGAQTLVQKELKLWLYC